MERPESPIHQSVSVLVVGAGLSGLTAARLLHDSGVDVLVLEKSRGLGGRCATRRIADMPFDHGAQFFTVRDRVFARVVAEWTAAGLTRVWAHGFSEAKGGFAPDGHARYCACKGMNSIPKAIAEGVVVETLTTVRGLMPVDDGWLVATERGRVINAKVAILTAPLPQSMQLLQSDVQQALREAYPSLSDVSYEPCVSVLALLDGPSAVPEPGAAEVGGGAIAWIADNTQKLNRAGASSLTIHTSPAFSREHFEAPEDEIARMVLEDAKNWLNSDVLEWQVHRWRYSKPVGFVGKPCVPLGNPLNLVLCGDCMMPPSRVEGALMSGAAAAETVLRNRPEFAAKAAHGLSRIGHGTEPGECETGSEEP